MIIAATEFVTKITTDVRMESLGASTMRTALMDIFVTHYYRNQLVMILMSVSPTISILMGQNTVARIPRVQITLVVSRVHATLDTRILFHGWVAVILMSAMKEVVSAKKTQIVGIHLEAIVVPARLETSALTF